MTAALALIKVSAPPSSTHAPLWTQFKLKWVHDFIRKTRASTNVCKSSSRISTPATLPLTNNKKVPHINYQFRSTSTINQRLQVHPSLGRWSIWISPDGKGPEIQQSLRNEDHPKVADHCKGVNSEHPFIALHPRSNGPSLCSEAALRFSDKE